MMLWEELQYEMKGKPMKVIAIKERSAGNDTVGDMWLDTKTFYTSEPIGNVIEWGNGLQKSGKLILTVPDDEESTG